MDATIEFDPAIPPILPHVKVYLIQVGYKLFRLSGASLSSDAPSYFTSFFTQEGNADKVLFIDRNPVIFEKIYNHLQGYHIAVENDYDFVHLWLDSFYFGLKRLQLYLDDEDVFASIGGRSFKIPKRLLRQTGNYPNFFLMNYDTLISDSKRIILEKGMIRPPPQRPATAANRLPKLFADLIEILKGNTLIVQNDEHRRLLVKECGYYHFLELEQRILKHHVLFNPFLGRSEIIMRLCDLLSKGVTNESSGIKDESPVHYQRPHMAKEPKRSLIVQVDSTIDSQVKLIINRTTQVCCLVCSHKVAHLFMQVFKKVSPSFREPLENNRLTLICGLSESKAIINGTELKDDWSYEMLHSEVDEPELKKRKITGPDDNKIVEFRLTKSLWRVMVRRDLARLQAVSIEGQTDQMYFNKSIEFL